MIKKYIKGEEIKSTKKMTKGPQVGLIKVILRDKIPGVPGTRLFVSEQYYRENVLHTFVARTESECDA